LAGQKGREPGGATDDGSADGQAGGQAGTRGPDVGVPAARAPGPARPPGSAEPPATTQPPGSTQPSGSAVPAARTPATTEPGSTEDEQAEIERLRAEVSELRAQQAAGGGATAAGQPAAAARRGGRWRSPVAAVAIILACILAPISVLSIWAANQVSNTDRYVATMAPLISEPPIQQALSAKITQRVTAQADISALTAQASSQLAAAHLPRLATLVHNFQGPITSGINSFIGTSVSRIVASPAIATLWVAANRTAHQGVVRVLSGQGGGAVSVVNNEVVLNIGPMITQVQDQLTARGLTFASKIPTVNATFPLFEAPNLAKAQAGYRLLLTLKWLLPLLMLLLFAVGIYVARVRRHALIGAALGFAGSMLVLAIGLAIARHIYLDSVPSNVLPSDAAAAAYDTLVRFIREALRALLVLGLIVAAAAYLAGPGALAVRTRRAVASGIGWLSARGERAGLRTGPVGLWTAAHKTALRIGAVVLAVLIFVFWGQPSVGLVITIVILLLVALGLIELIGGRGKPVTQPAAGP